MQQTLGCAGGQDDCNAGHVITLSLIQIQPDVFVLLVSLFLCSSPLFLSLQFAVKKRLKFFKIFYKSYFHTAHLFSSQKLIIIIVTIRYLTSKFIIQKTNKDNLQQTFFQLYGLHLKTLTQCWA